MELAQLSRLPQASISQHLANLRENGRLTTRREGKNTYSSISNPKITQACEIIREVMFEHLAKEEKIAKSILQSGYSA
jgi:ArsR family transcriptional regulator